MTTLLERIDLERRTDRERLRLETRDALRAALRDLLPGIPVIVLGSLTQPGRFTEASDVDLALESEPPDCSIYQLSSLLGERLGRSVDVMLLPECRFRDKILVQGERWMPLA